MAFPIYFINQFPAILEGAEVLSVSIMTHLTERYTYYNLLNYQF